MQAKNTKPTPPVLLVLAICAVLIVFVSSAVLHRINGVEDRVINFDAEILILGNSQLLGVTGTTLGDRVYNAAVSGSDYSVQYAILKSLSKRMPRLDTLVIGFDNIPLRTFAIRNMNGDYRKIVSQGVSWLDIPEVSFAEKLQYFFRHDKLLEPLVFGPKLNFERIESLLPVAHAVPGTKTAKIAFESSAADVVRPGFQYSPAQGREKMQAYMHALETNSHFNINRQALMDIIQLCRDHSIRMLLVHTPTTLAFQETRSAQWNQELAKLRSEIAVKYSGTIFSVWEISETESYPLSMFRDPNHLARAGLQLYNRELDTLLRQLN